MSDDDRDTILVVEDDPATRTFLADNLSADGFELLVAESARHALRLLGARPCDLALLDLGLPDGDGLDLLARVRASDGLDGKLDRDLPVIVLSGRGSELERMRGWDRGCDGYVVKPFSYPELRAQIAAVLRRARPRPKLGLLRVGELTIDPAAREVAFRDRRIPLAQKEFALLRALAAEPTRVFTKEELLRDVWGFRALGQTRTLDSHACRLRQKLAARGGAYVVNVWGVGYKLVDAPAAAVAA
jgi:DNA-binding response OmpR family regulator